MESGLMRFVGVVVTLALLISFVRECGDCRSEYGGAGDGNSRHAAESVLLQCSCAYGGGAGTSQGVDGETLGGAEGERGDAGRL